MTYVGLKEFLYEQQGGPMPPGGPGGGGGGPGGPGGPGGEKEQPTDEEQLFKTFEANVQVDELIQLMQMEGYADRIILQTIKDKFYPEVIYMARQILTKNLEKQKMQGAASDIEGDMGAGPGAGSMF